MRFLGRLGFFRHEGMAGRGPAWYPRARVDYGNGNRSVPMCVGNAWDYARLFGGEVVPVDDAS